MEGLSLFGAYLGAGIAIAVAGFGGAVAIGIMMSKALESTARQPEVLPKLRPLVFIGIAFIEAIVLYAFVIAILLLGKQAG